MTPCKIIFLVRTQNGVETVILNHWRVLIIRLAPAWLLSRQWRVCFPSWNQQSLIFAQRNIMRKSQTPRFFSPQKKRRNIVTCFSGFAQNCMYTSNVRTQQKDCVLASVAHEDVIELSLFTLRSNEKGIRFFWQKAWFKTQAATFNVSLFCLLSGATH